MRIFLLMVLLIISNAIQAQKPITLIIPFPPGGSTDIVGRIAAEALSKELGQPFVVDNRGGAGGALGAKAIAEAAPDGYTLGVATVSTHVVNPVVVPLMRGGALGYDALKDFAYISQIAAVPNVVSVHPSVPARNMGEFISYVKANPGKLNFGTPGNGSLGHLIGETFKLAAGVDMVHVPYKGGAPAVQSVLAGDTQLSFATPPSVLPLVQAGRLRALAVTSRAATPLVPGVPGMGEAGLPDYEISFWYGFFVPAGTPPEVVRKLFGATSQALKLPEIARMLARDGTETVGSASPEEYAAFLATDAKLWQRIVKEGNVKAD
jgi:tripartite-type tricarboxylate transporter receptor subunit TctC